MTNADSVTRRAALVGAAVTAALLYGGGVAHAETSMPHVHLLKRPATTSARVVRFTAPANHALVKSKLVSVHVKAGPRVTGVKVFAGTKDVSSRFSQHGGAFTAKLPRSLFKAGTNRLLVQARTRGGKSGGAATVSIVVPRSAPGLMSMATGAHAASAAGANPAAGLGYLPRTPGQIPVAIHTRTATYARLTVNGHRVSDLRSRRLLKDHSWLVSARDGLKVGANRLAVESWDKQGRHSVKRWTVKRSASRPLTDAGPRERIVKPSTWTMLDATKSRATKKGAKLRYAWRVVKAPKGAKPVLRDATAAKPQFKPDKPGVYQLALSAAQGKVASEDVTTLDAVPAIGASGLYIDTGLFGSPNRSQAPYSALWIEGQPYAYGADSAHPDDFVQLDETTLAVVASGTHDQIIPNAGTITIGAWGNVPIDGSSSGSAIWIGTTQVALNADNDAFDNAEGNGITNLHGWIQPASVANADDATWVDSDMLQIKTRMATDSATTNTMDVNGTKLPQTLPAGVQAGYQLVILDHAGVIRFNQLYPIMGNSSDAATYDRIVTDIDNQPTNSTVLLQGFGGLPPIDSSTALANKIQTIGGRADVVDRFNSSWDSTGGVYALISAPSPTAHNTWSSYAAAEVSDERTGAFGSQPGTSGSLSALLVRDAAANDYIPMTSDSGAPDPDGTSRYGIMPIAYAAPSSWTNWIRNDDGTLRAPTTAESAAYGDLLKQVQSHDWVPKTQLCPTAPDAIRGFYCTTDANSLQTLLNRISNQLKFNAGTAGGRYSETDWDTVQYTIEDELGDVSNIRSAIADYQGLFGTASLDGAVNAPAIGDAIKAAINKQTDVPTYADLDNLLSGLTDMASVIPEIGAPMTFMSGAFSLMSAQEPDTNVQDVLGTVQVTQDTAATTLVAAFQNASQQLSRYGDLLIADPVKLQQGADYMMNDDPQTSDSNSAFVHGAEYATQQWLWGTELSTAYTEWVVPRYFGWSPTCSVGENSGDPFWNGQSNPAAQWIAGYGADFPNETSHWILGYDSDAANASNTLSFAIDSRNGTVPILADASIPTSLTKPLFGWPVSPTTAPSATANAGAVMPYFALDYLHFKTPPLIPDTDQTDWGPVPHTPNTCEPHAGIIHTGP
jgi:hypothetical protein